MQACGDKSPFELAADVYAREPCANTFQCDLAAHLLYGYVFSAPELFIMGRPVEKNAPEHLILDPAHPFDSPDAWLIWLAAGDLSAFPRCLPYPLGFFGLQRHNILRWYPAAKFLGKIEAMGFMRGTGRPNRFILPPRSAPWVRPASEGTVIAQAPTAAAATRTDSSGRQCTKVDA